MARPLANIDIVEFEKLCALQCTRAEICDWSRITDKTLDAWCKRTYGKRFSVIFSQKRSKGKISLRRTQFQLAEKSPAMAIFLGKQYLGQSDKVETEVRLAEISPEVQAEVDEIIKGCGNDGETNTTTSD